MFLKAVVGLGNPGSQYVNTRHNIGFQVVDELANHLGVDWEDTGLLHRVLYQNNEVALLLVKPMTYMNSSGRAVLEVMKRFDLPLTDVLVVVDDVHLDLGRLRFRRQGSHGGHNGLRSIIDDVGSAEFPRLRIGVGKPPNPNHFIGYVLGNFGPEEIEVVQDAILKASKGVMGWVSLGIEWAMNQFNT